MFRPLAVVIHTTVGHHHHHAPIRHLLRVALRLAEDEDVSEALAGDDARSIVDVGVVARRNIAAE